MSEWIHFSLTAANHNHSYSQKSTPQSNTVQELVAPLHSLGLEMQQVVGERDAGPPRCPDLPEEGSVAPGAIFEVAVGGWGVL